MNIETDNINNRNKIDKIDRGNAINQPDKSKRDEAQPPVSEWDAMMAKIEANDRNTVDNAAINIPKGEESVDQLRAKGRSNEWIKAAIQNKSMDVWAKKGLGLLFTASYAAEIDAKLDAFYNRPGMEKADLP